MAAFHPCTMTQATLQTYAMQHYYNLQQVPHSWCCDSANMQSPYSASSWKGAQVCNV